MSSYTMELGWLLRGFSQINEKPGLYASPQSVIENSREEFFKAVGEYPFRMWGDERDEPFKIRFEKAFLEYNYMREIGYQTPDAFILQLGSFLRRKMPIYTIHWRKVLEEMYTTETGHGTGTTTGHTTGHTTGNVTEHSVDTTDAWGKSTTNTDSKGHSDTNSTTRSGMSDTPQTELDLNLNNIDFASQVNKSENVTGTDTVNNTSSVTNTEDHSKSVGDKTTDSVGDSVGDSKTDYVNDNYGRGKDVFEIYDEWIQSGYDLFTPLFQDAIREELFMIFN